MYNKGDLVYYWHDKERDIKTVGAFSHYGPEDFTWGGRPCKQVWATWNGHLGWMPSYEVYPFEEKKKEIIYNDEEWE